MKPTVKCEICHRRGDGHWAGWHREIIGHNDFTLLGVEDEPPERNINKFRESQHSTRLYQCLSSWLWATRSRDRLFRLVSYSG